MYLWIGIDCDNYFKSIKEKVRSIENDLNINNYSKHLPMHISLKMSFSFSENNKNEIIEDISTYLKSLKPFNISVKKIEKYENIVWIRMINNEKIEGIHNKITKLLLDKYQIEPHIYDNDFIFHSTLFMEDDLGKIENAYLKIKDEETIKEMILNTFLIGTSEDGALGTYKIIKRIEI